MSSAKPAEEADLLAQVPSRSALASEPMRSASVAEVDAAAGLDGLDAERQARWLLPVPGGPRKMHDLGAVDELELGERQDAVPVERGLEGEVEAGERLDGDEPGHHQGILTRRFSRKVSSSAEQGVDGLERGDLAALDPAHGGVEDLEGARHLEADQVAADAVEALELECHGLMGGLPRPGVGRPRRRSRASGGRHVAGATGRGPAMRRRRARMRWRFGDGRVDPALVAGLRGADGGDQRPSSKMRISSASVMHLDRRARRVGHAVEIAADAHHALVRDAPFELEDGAVGGGRQRLEVGFSSAKASLTTRWVVACTRGLATVSSQWRSWALRSSRLRNERPRKKSSRM